MALNDAAIKALKAKDRVFAVADEKGLCIEVAVSGSMKHGAHCGMGSTLDLRENAPS